MTELSALLSQSQKQNEDYEKMVKALRETMEFLVHGPLFWEGAGRGPVDALSATGRGCRAPVKSFSMKSPEAKK